MNQVNTIKVDPPRRNKESDLALHVKTTKPIKSYTDWRCRINMSGGEVMILSGDEAKLFVEFAEQMSRPLNVPIVPPTTEG
jgi:hypothetical protein